MTVSFRGSSAGAVLLVAASLVSRSAYADGLECSDVYEQSQELMKPKSASTLLLARDMLLTCMRSGCKDWIVADCSKWLTEVESRIPTVVFSARDTAGRDLTDVRVTKAEGAPVMSRLDGRAIEMEAGEQTFVFVGPDGAKLETTVLVREGQKAQTIAAVFDAPPGLEPSAPRGLERATAPAIPTSTLRYVGYATAAVGAVGLGVGTVFGLRATGKKDSARCDSTGACEDGAAVAESRSAATTSTIGFVAGGALVAAGVVLILVTGSPSAPRSAHVRPMVGMSGGGLELGGRW